MFEAKLTKAELFKKIVEAIKDLVQDAPFDCSEQGLALQVIRGMPMLT
jgi:proliferating cell nuclear antigen